MAKLCVLNLSDPQKKLQVVDSAFPASARNPITDPNLIDDASDALILYVVGHAIPDAVLALAPSTALAGSPILVDTAFANLVRSKRHGKKTLIILDVCFARSFEQTGGAGWSDEPFVLLFSCESYEQAWHTGGSSDPLRQTLFSIALAAAIRRGVPDWDALETALCTSLSAVQRPSIPLRNGPLLSDFDWAGQPAVATIAAPASNVAQARP